METPYLELGMATVVGLAIGAWIGVWVSAMLSRPAGLRIYGPVELHGDEPLDFDGKCCEVCGRRASGYDGGYKCSECFFIEFDYDRAVS